MHRLVYYSANKIGGTVDHMRSGMNQILAASRRNNGSVGLTGALMFSAGYFGQVLEGPQEAIEATFERIQQDRRHGDVNLLEFKEVANRSFGDWSMAFVGKADEVFADWGNEGFDFSVVTGELLLSKLRVLVSRDAAAA
jgi:hypothetical protein